MLYVFSWTSLYVSGNLKHCLYSKSEKMLGARDLGARVIIQSFPEEPSFVKLKGVQFRDLGQAFHKHLSSLALVGAMRGRGSSVDLPVFLFFYVDDTTRWWYVGLDNWEMDTCFQVRCFSNFSTQVSSTRSILKPVLHLLARGTWTHEDLVAIHVHSVFFLMGRCFDRVSGLENTSQ